MGTDEALSGHALVRCPGCGALVPDVPGLPHPYIGASAGCWEIFGQILAKEYGDYGYPITTHQLTVDAYAVQHPGQPERRSIQSVNSHLISLYVILERNWSTPDATALLRRLNTITDQFVWLDPPKPNGRITVLDVVKARDLTEHRSFVERWARDVWQAWAKHHDHMTELAKSLQRTG